MVLDGVLHASLCNLPRLAHLILKDFPIHGDLHSLSNCTQLISLTLDQTANIKGNIASLKGMVRLEVYWLTRMSQVVGSVEALSAMDRVMSVVLHGCSVSGDVQAFSNKSKLKYLNFPATLVAGD